MKRHLPIITIFLLVAGCNNDYTHELPNGYSLWHMYSGSIAIANPQKRIVVGPSKYGAVIGVKGNYIVGNLETEEKEFGVGEIPDKYFVIDTTTGTVSADLSSSDYVSMMTSLKLGEISLKRPSKLDYK